MALLRLPLEGCMAICCAWLIGDKDFAHIGSPQQLRCWIMQIAFFTFEGVVVCFAFGNDKLSLINQSKLQFIGHLSLYFIA